jgi:hypothetical protein
MGYVLRPSEAEFAALACFTGAGTFFTGVAVCGLRHGQRFPASKLAMAGDWVVLRGQRVL